VNHPNIEQILTDWEEGKRVRVPYDRGMGPRWARAYYQQQNPIRCALFGHKISGLINEHYRCECFRCGGQFQFNGNPSVWEFFFLQPYYRITNFLQELMQ
jgi:hypothetical protein